MAQEPCSSFPVAPLPPGPVDIVGDVHGELGALDALLDRLGYVRGRHPEGRRLVFVGDLIDRGPDSAGVLERVNPGSRRASPPVFSASRAQPAARGSEVGGSLVVSEQERWRREGRTDA